MNEFGRLLSISLTVHSSGDIVLDLSEVVVDIMVALLESLLGELSDSSSSHAALILEEAGWSSKEALERNNLLKETKLRFGSSLGVGLWLDCLLDGWVNLWVNLRGWETLGVKRSLGTFSWLGKSLLNHTGDFLNMSLSINSSGVNSVLLLNSKYQTYRDKALSKLETRWLIGLLHHWLFEYLYIIKLLFEWSNFIKA